MMYLSQRLGSAFQATEIPRLVTNDLQRPDSVMSNSTLDMDASFENEPVRRASKRRDKRRTANSIPEQGTR